MNLEELKAKTNIAEDLDDTQLADIAQRVYREYEIDEESREEWMSRMKGWLKLAMQVYEKKDSPFENAANIKHPLLTTAAVQFSSRTLPNIVKDRNVVKGKVIGKDEMGLKQARADRIGAHMSYQCVDEMDEWIPDTDRGLTFLPIVGCFFKKTYFSNVFKRNVSEFRSPKDVCINYKAKSVPTAPRITDILELYPTEIEERKRNKVFLDIDYGTPTSGKHEEDEINSEDTETPHVFLEQHRRYDLDGDGYAEPYIITLHKDSKQVARVVANWDNVEYSGEKVVSIKPVEYFTKFSFMPAPDGGIYDYGFGAMIGPINEVINTTINQLLDAGTRANSFTGFIGKGLNLGRGRGSGNLTFKLNEWKNINYSGDDIRKNLFPMPTKEPSLVLFQLLGFMVDAGEKMSVTELLTGDQSVQNEPATTSLARIEQGLKVFSAIHLRIHKSLKSEYRKLYRLNGLFLNDETYYRVMDDELAIFKTDYESESIDVEPVSGDLEITDAQKLAKAQMLMGLMGMGFNDKEIRERLLEAANIPDRQKLLEGVEPPPPKPELMLKAQELELKRAELEFNIMKFGYEMAEIQSKVILNLAKAESEELGPQLEKYKADMQGMVGQIQAMQRSNNGNNKAPVQSVEKGPGNGGLPSDAGGAMQ